VRDTDFIGASFRLMFDLNPAPMFLYDWADLRIVQVNDAALAQYGYTREQFLSLELSDILLSGATEEWVRQRDSEADLVRVGVRRHRKSDGTVFFVDIMRDRLTVDGRTIALVAAPDATERIMAEERLRQAADELRHSQEVLDRAQRIASTGSVARDFLTQRTTWSDETYRIFGVTRDSFTPSPAALLSLVHPEDRDRVRGTLAEAAKGNSCALQYRIIRPDGVERMVHRDVEVVFDEAGQPVRSVSIIRDVTEAFQAAERQKKLEAELRVAKDAAEAAARAVQAANADLERRVEERTAELKTVQDELLKNERLSALGQLTATVAHELRNPLSAIKNTIFVVKEIAAARSVDIDRPINRIQRSIDRCNHIIADLLDFSLIRDLHLRVRNFDDWLAEVTNEQKMPDGVALVMDLRAGRARVRFDPERFRQVVVNLFDNALQAMAEAGRPVPRITVRSRVVQRRIEIAIEDEGPGIAPEHMDRVFEPLFSTKSFGTGLGLPTVKQIVEQHGGEMELKSVVGEGTRVVIRLPLLVAEAA
jgi:PAS domain S-box-containing protein